MKDLLFVKDFLWDYNFIDKVIMYKIVCYGGDWYVLFWCMSVDIFFDVRVMVLFLLLFLGKDVVFVKFGC